MICKHCGNEININDKFCGVCGAEVEFSTMLVDDSELGADRNPYVQPQPDAAQYNQPVQQPVQQPVDTQYGQPVQQYGQPVQQYGQPVQQYGYVQPVQPVQPMQPQYPAAPPVPNDPVLNSLAGKTLAFGIVSLSCACFSILFFLFTIGLSVLYYTVGYVVFSIMISAAAIVFGALAKGSSGQYARTTPLSGKVRTGRILGNIGFIMGIVFTSILFIVLIALAASF